ncbi:hypothetical protein ACFYWX_35530 [Streptomyces sp. NPDC002888]|uniref:hypothetical protein n=1 Tax=Streptomyces sp. NPDC002888 TaxID=3364668 RepID=UPI0036A7DE20
MPALPAWRIASSALCAALLVGITGPASMAADSAREHRHAASPDVRLLGTDALLAQARKVNGGALTPVADLLHAVLEADHGRLPAAEARTLGAAAKGALAKEAAKAPATSATPTAPAPASALGTGVLLLPTPVQPAAVPASDELDAAGDESDAVEEALDALEEGIDDLLGAITSGGDAEVLPSVDDLLTELQDLIDALLGGSLPLLPALSGTSTSTPSNLVSSTEASSTEVSSTEVSSTEVSSTDVSSTQVSSVPAGTLPAFTMSTTGLLPVS